MTFKEKLLRVQTSLKAPKDQYNDFGKYKYRSCESILEAVKPLLSENKLLLNLTDDIVAAGDRIYVKATATLLDAEDTNEQIQTTAFAREPIDKKGMDDSQVTGTASSYARKYALNAMFLIDDTKDADTNEHHEEVANRKSQRQKKEEPAKKEPTMVEKIQGLLQTSGIPEAWVCEMYKVENIQDIKPGYQKGIINHFKDLQAKYKEMVEFEAEVTKPAEPTEDEYYENIMELYGGQR